jgi:hypothetical protein
MIESHFYINVLISTLILIITLFNTGKIIALQKHNNKQDASIADMQNDIEHVERDLEAMSKGQSQMYDDFKGTLQGALKPVIDAHNEQSKRLDRVLELLIK